MKRRIDLQKAAEAEAFGALAVGENRKHRGTGAVGRFTPAQNRAVSDLARSLVKVAKEAGQTYLSYRGHFIRFTGEWERGNPVHSDWHIIYSASIASLALGIPLPMNRYTFPEFLEDFERIEVLRLSWSKQVPLDEQIFNNLGEVHGRNEATEWRYCKFMAVVVYVATHIEHFNKGVVGYFEK